MDTPVSLLERLRQPAADGAWARFVDLYAPVLHAWARRAGCQEAEAADLVQEVFALLVQKLPGFAYDHKKSFRAWLHAVAHNCWRNLRRKSALPVGPGLDPAELPAPDPSDPFWDVEYRDRLVGRALGLMQAEFRPATWKACWRCVVDGTPAADVARELGISTGAVYMAKSRVLSRLRRELDGLWD